MERKNVLIICGGGSTEHDVSIRSAAFIKEQVELLKDYNAILVVMDNQMNLSLDGASVSLNGHILETATQRPYINYVIPVIHGPPGESGEIQSYLEGLKLPYLGPEHEGSILCFNKVSTKLWFDHLQIKNSPWTSVHKSIPINLNKVKEFFNNSNKDVFIKAAEQGSSVGCYHATKEEELEELLTKALSYSDDVLVERTIHGRELEIAVFEQDSKLIATVPGEILTSGDVFYDYDQKYSSESKAQTHIEAKGLTPQQIEEMQNIAKTAFQALKLRHLSRVDFFLSQDGDILLNEINTFPGMTKISMFPKMLENTGLKFSHFLKDKLDSQLNK